MSLSQESIPGADGAAIPPACAAQPLSLKPIVPKRRERGKKRKTKGPKRPLSAYTLFLVSVRNKVSKENPRLPFKEVAQRVGLMWKELPEDEKERYRLAANDDKKRYTREKREYVDAAKNLPPEESDQLVGGKRKRKLKGSPKNPLSAYTFFLMDMRRQVKNDSTGKLSPDLNFRDMAIRIGEMWKELDPETKEEYNKKAKNDRMRYEEEMVKWKAQQNHRAEMLAKEVAERDQLTNTDKFGMPRNAFNGYTYFVMEQRHALRQRNSEVNAEEANSLINNAWENLSAVEKTMYHNRANGYNKQQEQRKLPQQEYEFPSEDGADSGVASMSLDSFQPLRKQVLSNWNHGRSVPNMNQWSGGESGEDRENGIFMSNSNPDTCFPGAKKANKSFGQHEKNIQSIGHRRGQGRGDEQSHGLNQMIQPQDQHRLSSHNHRQNPVLYSQTQQAPQVSMPLHHMNPTQNPGQQPFLYPLSIVGHPSAAGIMGHSQQQQLGHPLGTPVHPTFPLGPAQMAQVQQIQQTRQMMGQPFFSPQQVIKQQLANGSSSSGSNNQVDSLF